MQLLVFPLSVWIPRRTRCKQRTTLNLHTPETRKAYSWLGKRYSPTFRDFATKRRWETSLPVQEGDEIFPANEKASRPSCPGDFERSVLHLILEDIVRKDSDWITRSSMTLEPGSWRAQVRRATGKLRWPDICLTSKSEISFSSLDFQSLGF